MDEPTEAKCARVPKMTTMLQAAVKPHPSAVKIGQL